MRKLLSIVFLALLSACASPSDGPSATNIRNASLPNSNEKIPVIQLADAPVGFAGATTTSYAPTDAGLSAFRSGGYVDKGIQVGMRRLADLLTRNNYLGAYEAFTPQTARTGIGARRGVVAFNRIPDFTGGGHIDLVLGSADAARCASGCYYQSETIWFWPLQSRTS